MVQYNMAQNNNGTNPFYAYTDTTTNELTAGGYTVSSLTKNVCYAYEPTCLPGYEFQTGVVGQYGDGCAPRACRALADCPSVAPYCNGYVATGTTFGSCTGTPTATVSLTGYMGNTLLYVGFGGVAGSVATFTYPHVPGSTNAIEYEYFNSSAAGCASALNTLCQQLTNQATSTYVGATSGTTSYSIGYQARIYSCGASYTGALRITSPSYTWHGLDALKCSYTPTAACSTYTSSSTCTAHAGCSVVTTTTPEVMGQCQDIQVTNWGGVTRG